MKKNIAMRVAAFLFILTMISTCAFATTFAKYTTSKSATDEARVAKWGVTVAATNEDALFASAYGSTVKSLASPQVDIIAPGTKGELAGFTITGTPEVSVGVTYSATLTLENWDASGEYCPIIITVEEEDYYIGKDVSTSSINGMSSIGKIDSVSELKTAVETAVTACSGTYNVGLPIQDTLNVSWEWVFDNKVADFATNYPGLVLDDVKDTALGDWERLGNAAPTIQLDVTCTVTQID